jgi:cytochrome c peroxidase
VRNFHHQKWRWIQFFLLTILFAPSCKPNSEWKDLPLEYPSHFPKIYYPNVENNVSKEGIELGRQLFYDTNLSLTRNISCGSCHAQIHGFADHNRKTSAGIWGRLGNRNSPGLFNLAWNSSFMWDGGVNHLDILPLAPITDTTEMGLPIQSWILRVREQSRFKPLFQSAFGSDSITERKTLWALSQFMLSLITANSKYDQVKLGNEKFSIDEQAGYSIFQQNCNGCHTEPLFTNFTFQKNGFTNSGDDRGRMRITEDLKDLYKFKVPSLRNLTLTYPYMHNGNMSSLEQVIEHYENVKFDPSNPLLKPLSLNAIEKIQLIKFLETLTDFSFISNHAHAEP